MPSGNINAQVKPIVRGETSVMARVGIDAVNSLVSLFGSL